MQAGPTDPALWPRWAPLWAGARGEHRLLGARTAAPRGTSKEPALVGILGPVQMTAQVWATGRRFGEEVTVVANLDRVSAGVKLTQ